MRKGDNLSLLQPYNVIRMLYNAQYSTDPQTLNQENHDFWDLTAFWGALKTNNNHGEAFQNNKDPPGESLWRSSEGAWSLLRGCMGSPGTLGRVSGGLEKLHGVSWDGLESSWIHSGVSLGIPGGFIWGHARVLCGCVYVCVCVFGFSV